MVVCWMMTNVNMTVDFGFETGFFDLAMIKTVSDLSPTPILGGSLIYDLTVFNQGTDVAYDVELVDYVPEGLTLNDTSWVMMADTAVLVNTIDSIPVGDSATVSITFTIDEDYQSGPLVNNAEISFATDIPGGTENVEDNDSSPGDEDGSGRDMNDDDTDLRDGSDDYDGELVCIINYACANTTSENSCQTQAQIDASYAQWLDEFVAEGCAHYGTFSDALPPAPGRCGGTVTVTWQLRDSLTNSIVMECSADFTVIPDDQGPVCPTGWDITVPSTTSACSLPAYEDLEDLFDQTGIIVFDECGTASLSYTDSLVREECTNGGPNFDMRTVIRNYTFTDTCGNVSELCPQVIMYEIDACVQLTDFGVIGFGDSTSIDVPTGCDAPEITVTVEEQGSCGYVEYMWLVSTETDINGNPIIPTNFNIGTVWQMIPDAFDPTYDPGELFETTFFVRCARNFACCDFGESNIVTVAIDDTASCPDVSDDVIENTDCDNQIILISPTNDLMNSEQMKYTTNQEIDASNIVGDGARIILESPIGISLRAGLEIQSNSRLEVHNTGCPD